MKTAFLKTAAVIFLIGSVTACNKSAENRTESVYDSNSTTTVDTATVSGPTNAGSSEPDNLESNSNSPANSASSNAKTIKDKGSAPDGTNRENHDGDMYTKNDTTRMPSGTSIK